VTKEVINVANATHVLLESYSHSPYGAKTPSSTSISNPAQYAGSVGCYIEDETKLILCGARWYSPSLMRWMSRDPIGYDGGVNLYGYIGGDPINYVDPSGNAELIAQPDNSIFSHHYIQFKEGTSFGLWLPCYGDDCSKASKLSPDPNSELKPKVVLRKRNDDKFEDNLKRCIERDSSVWDPINNCQDWAKKMWICADDITP
jgi:RHS repeat-associated protein